MRQEPIHRLRRFHRLESTARKTLKNAKGESETRPSKSNLFEPYVHFRCSISFPFNLCNLRNLWIDYFLLITNVGTMPPPAVTFANSFEERRVKAEPTLPLKSSGSRSTSCSAN